MKVIHTALAMLIVVAAAILNASADARFLANDPVPFNPNDPAQFNRYAYGDNDPINALDPTGEDAIRIWSSPNKVTVLIPYTINDPGGVAQYTPAQVNAQIKSNLSGTYGTGSNAVTVRAVGQHIPAGSKYAGTDGTNTVTADGSHVDSSGNPRSAVMDGIGGSDVQMRSTAGPDVVAHELGHSAGAGDQYKGGVNAAGNVLSQDVPGASNIMKDLGGPANQQTLGEIIKAPTSHDVRLYD